MPLIVSEHILKEIKSKHHLTTQKKSSVAYLYSLSILLSNAMLIRCFLFVSCLSLSYCLESK